MTDHPTLEDLDATEPCDGRVCSGSDCPHERAAAELTRLDQHLGDELTTSERKQRLVEAHQVTIGQLRGAETRIRQLEERLRLVTDEKVADVVGPNIELLCEANARLKAEVAAARKFAAEMRDFCSPHGVSVHYADQLEAVMDRAKEGQS